MHKLYKIPRRFHIGMRTVKSAIAVALSMAVGYLISSPYPPFLAIGAMGAMETSISDSLKSSRDMIIGNFFGVLLGTFFAVFYPGIIPVTACAGTLMLIILCNFFGLYRSTNLACVVFICLLCDITGGASFFYGLMRFRDTVIGTLIALAVNILIRPYAGTAPIYRELTDIRQRLLHLMEERVLWGRIPNLDEVRMDIKVLDQKISVVAHERFNKNITKADIAQVYACQQLLARMNDSLISICSIDTMPSPNRKNRKRLFLLGLKAENKEAIMDSHSTDTDSIVLNYYLELFLDANKYLSQMINLK